MVDNGHEREFRDVYRSHQSPGRRTGLEDRRRHEHRNDDRFSCASQRRPPRGLHRHGGPLCGGAQDGASSHVAKALAAPENIRLHRLPGYSPEFNPREHLRDEIREKEFPNRVFCDMSGVVRTLETGLPRSAADPLESEAFAPCLGLLVSPGQRTRINGC